MPTNTQIKNTIDTDITNKVTSKSISPTNVGSNIKAVVDYSDQQDALKANINTLGPVAFSNSYNDLDGTPNLTLKEDLANKSTDGTLSGNSDDNYPSEKAVKTYVDAHSGGTSIVKSVKITLSSSQILDLFTTPIEIIPAVTGKLLIIRHLFQKYTHVSNAYTSSSWRIGYNSISYGFVGFAPAITSASNYESFNSINSSSSAGGSTFIGLPLVLGSQVSNPTGGDGTLDLYITYYEITI